MLDCVSFGPQSGFDYDYEHRFAEHEHDERDFCSCSITFHTVLKAVSITITSTASLSTSTINFSAALSYTLAMVTDSDDLQGVNSWKGFQFWLCVCLIALFIATHRLWIGDSSFPTVPSFLWLAKVDLPSTVVDVVEALGLILIAIGLIYGIAQCCLSLKWALIWWLIPFGWILTSLLNQHRWQPWAYHASLMCVLFATMSPQAGVRWARRLVVSIYLYSALGKFDAQFLHTVGPQFIEACGGWIGFDVTQWSEHVRTYASAMLPIGELTIAFMLAVPKLRQFGWVLATVMHSLLIAILSPLGLGHEWGVILWNVCFLGQSWLLFGRSNVQAISTSTESTLDNQLSPWIARLLICFAIVWPLGERWGWCDHWFAWALYSPHSSRTELWIAGERIRQMPDTLKPFIEEQAIEDQGREWHRFRMDQWSLKALRAPIYPQARFQYGVALDLVQRNSLGGDGLLRVLGTSNRLDGKRDVLFFGNQRDALRWHAPYWLNTRAN